MFNSKLLIYIYIYLNLLHNILACLLSNENFINFIQRFNAINFTFGTDIMIIFNTFSKSIL